MLADYPFEKNTGDFFQTLEVNAVLWLNGDIIFSIPSRVKFIHLYHYQNAKISDFMKIEGACHHVISVCPFIDRVLDWSVIMRELFYWHNVKQFVHLCITLMSGRPARTNLGRWLVKQSTWMMTLFSFSSCSHKTLDIFFWGGGSLFLN